MASLRAWSWSWVVACGALAGCGITIPGNLDIGIDDPSVIGTAGRGGTAARGGGVAGGIAGGPWNGAGGSGAIGAAGVWGGYAGSTAGAWAGTAGYWGGTAGYSGTAGYQGGYAGGQAFPYDRDGDGWSVAPQGSAGDCNDWDYAIHPYAMDACCDGLDSDCDGRDSPLGAECKCAQPEFDYDGDGWTSSQGDCDDRDFGVNPGTIDRCWNGRDENCDGVIDETNEDCRRLDADGDGCPGSFDCNDNHPMYCTICDMPDDVDNDRDGYPASYDCNDYDASIYPKAPEICGDARDNDCDGVVDGYPFCDSYIDWDRDGYPSEKDCNDGDSSVFPGSPYEVCCDNIDSNCDGWDGISNSICTCPVQNDRDGDGYGIGMSDPALADCNDQDPNIHPNAVEFCGDGRDNDCDGRTDSDDTDCVVID
jgi:hypothetical protein